MKNHNLNKQVYIIDNNSGGLRYDNRWKWVADEITRWGFDCKIIDGWKTQSTKLTTQAPFFILSSISNKLGQLFTEGVVESDCIFIFPDARDLNIIALHEYRVVNNLKFTMIGFWNDGAFKPGGVRKKSKENYYWTKKWERTLVECLDFNLISTPSDFPKFKSFYNKVRANEILQCGLPLSGTSAVVNYIMMDEHEEKEDLIIMNTKSESMYDYRLFEIVANEHRNCRFINCNQHNIPEVEYYRLLSISKVVFSVNLEDSHPYNILESMTMGAIPILPDIDIYKEYFGDEWLYDKRILRPPYLNFIRGREYIDDKILEYTKNYLSYNIKEIAQQIELEFFNSNELKEILCQL